MRALGALVLDAKKADGGVSLMAGLQKLGQASVMDAPVAPIAEAETVVPTVTATKETKIGLTRFMMRNQTMQP